MDYFGPILQPGDSASLTRCHVDILFHVASEAVGVAHISFSYRIIEPVLFKLLETSSSGLRLVDVPNIQTSLMTATKTEVTILFVEDNPVGCVSVCQLIY
jgi:hypothetical protein